MRLDTVDVAIIGGGITGLSAAWSLQQKRQGGAGSPRYALLEAGPRWGGKIRTDIVQVDGAAPFVVEAGPDSFITTKPWAWQLTKKLALDEQALPTNDDLRQIFVLNKGRPTPLPDGVMLIVPTEFTPFALSPLISPLGKLRMGMELVIPPRRDGQDETLADFIRRRLGDEALDKIAEPLMSGIYNADADRQSLLATFPRFRAIEEQHGSLIRGMIAARNGRGAPPSSNGQRPPSTFVSFRAGMEALVDAIVAQLDGDLRLEAPVTRIARTADGSYELTLPGTTLRARAVLLAIPSYTAADLLAHLAPRAAEELRRIRYVGTGTISLAYRRAEFEHALQGFGIVIPRSEGRQINAITWTSSKFNHRAPDDHVLLRVFFGGSRTPHMMDQRDDRLQEIVRQELANIMGVRAEPVLSRIYRWPEANPQYDVGHLDRVAAIEEALPAGLFVAGSPYRGIGLPDCIKQAADAIDTIWEWQRTASEPRFRVVESAR